MFTSLNYWLELRGLPRCSCALKRLLISVIIFFMITSSTHIAVTRAAEMMPPEPKGVILETLISVDDPQFKGYDSSTNTGVIAKITYNERGYREYISLAKDTIQPPPQDYFFRYLTGLPIVNTSTHWFLYFKHTLVNTGDVIIDNVKLDGWNAFVIDEEGSEYTTPRALWRLYKYEVKCPSSIPVGGSVTAITSYQIHNIPRLRAVFTFSFLASGEVLDSWSGKDMFSAGREIVKFVGSDYVLPKLNLIRFKPGSTVITPPEIIDYGFNVTNRLNSNVDLSVSYKFAQTVTWELNLWPSAYQGLVGSEEITLPPNGTWTKRLSTMFPPGKDDHAVYVDFAVLITSGENVPPLLGEVWEHLYGANSYLGITGVSTSLTTNGGKPVAQIFFNLVSYASPCSMDVLPYEYNYSISVYDASHDKLIIGPKQVPVSCTIKKGGAEKVIYSIPLEELRKGGKYLIQIDTYRYSERTGIMNYARVITPLLVNLPDLEVSKGSINIQKPFKLGSPNIITITVRNLGKADALNATIVLYVDNNSLKILEETIPAQSDFSCDISWTPTKDKHKVSLVVDPNNMIYELNEDNNDVERSYSSMSPPASAVFSQYNWLIIIFVATTVLVVSIMLKVKKYFHS